METSDSSSGSGLAIFLAAFFTLFAFFFGFSSVCLNLALLGAESSSEKSEGAGRRRELVMDSATGKYGVISVSRDSCLGAGDGQFTGVQPRRVAGIVFGETGGEDMEVDVSSVLEEMEPESRSEERLVRMC